MRELVRYYGREVQIMSTGYVAVDASGSFSQTRRDTALLRMHQAGVIPVDFASAMVEILADNASPLADDLYNAIDIPFAKLVTGLTHAAA